MKGQPRICICERGLASKCGTRAVMAKGEIEVIIGTYNHAVVGLQFLQEETEEKNWQFVPRFTDQGHDGFVKTVAASEKFLASGSTDETIRLYDLKKHVELGSLVQQSGSITSIAFSGNTHMLSASEDCTVCVWKCKTWECLKTLKGHREAVTSISIHPTGRLALSVSKDKTIRTWNLLTGRSAYTTNIKQVGEIVVWSPNGDTYVVASGSKATVYKISDASEMSIIACEKTILAMGFLTQNVLALAGEADEVVIFDIQGETTLQKFKAHDIRVKALKCIADPTDEDSLILFTVSSDGSLKAWGFSKDNMKENPKLLAELFIPGRPVCLTVKPVEFKQKSIKSQKTDVAMDEQATHEEKKGDENIQEDPASFGDAHIDSNTSIEDVDTVQKEERKSLDSMQKKSPRNQEPTKKKRKKKKKEG